MKKLIYKELALSLNPWFFLFALLGAMMLIPDYCYYVIFIYSIVVVINNVCATSKANKDTEFTAMLPVKKSDAVKARFLSICMYELVNIASAAIFAFLSYLLYGDGVNQAGIDVNVAFFGLVFIMLGGFNFIYFTGFYKTGYKVLMPLIWGGSFFFAFIAVAESLAQYVQSPVSAYLDASTIEGMICQLPILFAGIILFVILNFAGFRISAKRFVELDL